jgi:hypothetical protein
MIAIKTHKLRLLKVVNLRKPGAWGLLAGEVIYHPRGALRI